MAITLANLNSVIKPRFAETVREKAFNKLALWRSGAIRVVTSSELGLSYVEGATTLTLPYWDIDSTTATVLADTNTATSAVAIQHQSQVGRLLYLGRAWGTTVLAKHLAGSDPLSNLSDLVARFWAENYHKYTTWILDGLFEKDLVVGDHAGMEDHYIDQTASVVDGSAIREAMFKLGDSYKDVAIILMHSKVFAVLDDNEDIIQVPTADPGVLIPTLRGTGVPIYVDDSMPEGAGGQDIDANESSVFLLGKGAFLFSEFFDYIKPKEEASTGQVELHNRKVFLLHPNGINWDAGADTQLCPTEAQLKNGDANWTRKWNVKNVPIIRCDVTHTE